MQSRPSLKGFTLLEILLVVAAIAILAGVVIIAVNPGKQLADTRNATRQTDVKTISDAVYQYSFDHGGVFPSGIDTNLRMLGTFASGCGITCGSAAVSSPTTIPLAITDNSASTFNTGNYSSTIFNNANNWVQLTNGGSAGAYTSSIKDGGSDSAAWSTLAWVPQFPNNKELPNNGGSETGYPSGNVNMTGNVLLLHLNESAGATNFTDASGSNNIGSCSGAACPSADTGKFNGGMKFDGASASIQLGNWFNLQTFSIVVWINPGSSQKIYADIMDNNHRNGINWVIQQDASSQNRYYWGMFDGSPIIYFNLVPNKWQLLTITRNTDKQNRVYVNDALIASQTGTKDIFYDGNQFLRLGNWGGGGRNWAGLMDEVALFNRAISATEVTDIYKRGATRLKFQVRSCSNAACSGASFAGPDSTANTFFTELSNVALSTPSFSLTNVGSNRYFQYKASFETDNVDYSPELKSLSIDGTTVNQPADSGNSGPTVDACLDLSSQLASDYLNAIPFDSKLGSANNTYYAIKKTAGGRIMVQACAAENGKSIIATK